MTAGLLCRCCGKPIPKYTTHLYFKPEQTKFDHPNAYTAYSYGPLPKTRAEAQARTNQIVVGIKRHKVHRDVSSYVTSGDGGTMIDMGIASASVWDGVRYVDQFFCKNACAIDFAHVFAKLGYQCKAHEDAKKAALNEHPRNAP